MLKNRNVIEEKIVLNRLKFLVNNLTIFLFIKQLIYVYCHQAKKVEDVRQSWEKYATDLKEKIDKKLETSQEFRETKFKNIQERIKEHISENVCFLFYIKKKQYL